MAPFTLPRLAAALPRLAPSCGSVRLVAVDGHAGSGKSTFTRQLAAALGGAPVLALDDLATHEELFAWTGRLTEQVLDPLRRGEPAHYREYDWHARCPGPAVELPPAPVVLVEGVGAGRASLRPHLACLLWMELPREESWRRGRRRDGSALEAFWDGWTSAERRHFAADPSRSFAHLLVRQRDTRRPPGAPGAPGAPGPEGAETAETTEGAVMAEGVEAAGGPGGAGGVAGGRVPGQRPGPERLLPGPQGHSAATGGRAYAVLPGPMGGLPEPSGAAGSTQSITHRDNYPPANQPSGK